MKLQLSQSRRPTPAFPRMQDICTIVEPEMLGYYRLMCVLLHLVKMVHGFRPGLGLDLHNYGGLNQHYHQNYTTPKRKNYQIQKLTLYEYGSLILLN